MNHAPAAPHPDMRAAVASGEWTVDVVRNWLSAFREAVNEFTTTKDYRGLLSVCVISRVTWCLLFWHELESSNEIGDLVKDYVALTDEVEDPAIDLLAGQTLSSSDEKKLACQYYVHIRIRREFLEDLINRDGRDVAARRNASRLGNGDLVPDSTIARAMRMSRELGDDFPMVLNVLAQVIQELISLGCELQQEAGPYPNCVEDYVMLATGVECRTRRRLAAEVSSNTSLHRKAVMACVEAIECVADKLRANVIERLSSLDKTVSTNNCESFLDVIRKDIGGAALQIGEDALRQLGFLTTTLFPKSPDEDVILQKLAIPKDQLVAESTQRPPSCAFWPSYNLITVFLNSVNGSTEFDAPSVIILGIDREEGSEWDWKLRQDFAEQIEDLFSWLVKRALCSPSGEVTIGRGNRFERDICQMLVDRLALDPRNPSQVLDLLFTELSETVIRRGPRVFEMAELEVPVPGHLNLKSA